MRKIKLVSIIILFIIILGVTTSMANYDVFTVPKTEEYQKWESLTNEEREKTIEPVMYSVLFKDSIKRSKYNQLLKVGANLEPKYSLKDNLTKIIVKNQQQTGSCWAFSFSSMIETSLAKQTTSIAKEYSPMHFDYRTSQIFNRKVGDGGNYMLAFAYANDREGPVWEEELPFNSVYDEINNKKENYYLSDISKIGDLNKKAKARINDTKIFANIYKKYENGIVTYNNGNSANTYTREEVTAMRNVIKEHIQTKGALAANIYMDLENYNETTAAYYCNNTAKQINHAITIVGWDDNYSVDKFKATNKPVNKGAYIILNSYGDTFGDGGYNYVSYDDVFIESNIAGIDNIQENTTQNKPNKIYQYDELGNNQMIILRKGSNGMISNVFSRDKTKMQEEITEIGISVFGTQGIEIYLNSSDDNKDNLTLVASPGILENGYHIIKLATPIKLTGDKFVLAAKYINSEQSIIPIEANLKESNFTKTDNYYNTAKANLGESFIKTESTAWMEINGLDLGEMVILKNTNVCIKGFTTEQDTPIPIPVTAISLNKPQTTLKVGEVETLIANITPTDATNKKVIWTSSKPEIATINNGVVTAIKEGTTTITVTTEDGNKTATCNVTVEAGTVIPVTSISLNKKELIIEEGNTTNLVVTFNPENASNKKVIWTSSDEKIATISETGIIKALSQGTTIITATTQDGNKVATCKLNVSKKTNAADDIYKEDTNTAPGDNTKAPGILPKAGYQVYIIIAIILVSVIGTVVYIKYKIGIKRIGK